MDVEKIAKMENDIEHIKKSTDRLVERIDKHIEQTENRFDKQSDLFASKSIEKLIWSILAAGIVAILVIVFEVVINVR